MTSQKIVAEQASRTRYIQAAPLPTREIEMIVRLLIPERDGADVGINADFSQGIPEQWQDALLQRLYRGVHAGLAHAGAPLPPGGIEAQITHVRVSSPLSPESDEEDVRRLGKTLENPTAATIAGLWQSVVLLGVPSTA
jgi:hypothetical protein